MAISQAMCTSFKLALLDGEMDFSSDTSQTFKIALYTSSATLGAATTAYSVTNSDYFWYHSTVGFRRHYVVNCNHHSPRRTHIPVWGY